MHLSIKGHDKGHDIYAHMLMILGSHNSNHGCLTPKTQPLKDNFVPSRVA